MADKNKHDIMDALLKGTAEDTSPEALSIAKLIARAGETVSARESSGNPTSPAPEKSPGTDSKKKSTHYLSEDIFEDLGDARDKINELVQQHLKSRISKSKIVDQALRMILRDFEEKGEKSHLIKEILKGTHKKK